MQSAHSVLATFAPTVRPVGSEVLYSENLHIKSLIKQLLSVLLVVLMPVFLLTIYGLLASMPWNIAFPGFTSKTSVSFPVLNLIFVVGFMFIWYIGCGIAIFRAYYEWRHTVIELTRSELIVLRPRNVLLLLRRQERDSIRAASVVGFQTEKPTVSEFLFFHDCITTSVLISEIEGKKRSPVDTLPDVRNYKALGEAIRQLSGQRVNRQEG